MRPGSPTKGALSAAALAVLVASHAQASSTFPDGIRSQLGLAYIPDCSLCHAGTPAIGTATTPFATSMRARGLVAGSLPSLNTALAALEAEQTDSDHDGSPDIEELKADTDPNVAGGSLSHPTYGCFNVTDARPSAASSLGAALLRLLAMPRRLSPPENPRGTPVEPLSAARSGLSPPRLPGGGRRSRSARRV